MDPAQGETGGKPKVKSHSRVKDKVKNLKNRLPGMRKHAGGDDEVHDDSSEHDDGSPRAETGYNGGESTPFSTVNTTPASQADSNSPPSYDSRPSQINPSGYDSRPSQISPSGYDSRPSQISPSGYDSRPSQISPSGYDSRPSQISPSGYDSRPSQISPSGYDSRPSQISPSGYDSQNRGYAAAAPPTRPAPMTTDSPRSNLAPPMEEKFKYLDVGERPAPRVVNPPADPVRSYQPEQQQFSPSTTNPPISSYQPEQQAFSPNPQTDPIRPYQPEHPSLPSATNPRNDPIRGYQPEQQYSPSTTESIQKGYSDGPRSSYRASPATVPANKGMVEKVRDSVTGAAVVLGDKMGYYNDTPAAPRDPNAPSILDRAKSTLGLDKPRDPNAPPLSEKARAYMSVASQKTREYGAGAADHAAWTRDRVAEHSTPTHHDKALSEQVTQTLSTLPGAIREKVFGPASPSSNTANSPGIVDRVSGAMSSLFSAAPKNTAERLQHTFPAHSDYHGQPRAAAATTSSVPQNFPDRSGAEERTAASSASAYPPTYPMVHN